MSNPKEVTLKLKEATEKFTVVDRKTTDSNLPAINKALEPILMKVNYDAVESIHNLWGVIARDSDYTNQYIISFVVLAKQPLYKKKYDGHNDLRSPPKRGDTHFQAQQPRPLCQIQRWLRFLPPSRRR